MKRMIIKWQEFPIGPGDAKNELHVTLNKRGLLLIGARAYERFGRPENAVLLFDQVNSLIGVQASNRHAPNAYPLIRENKTNKGNFRIIRASRFCRHYAIRVGRTIAFVDPTIDPDGVLVLDLKQTRTIGKPKQPRDSL